MKFYQILRKIGESTSGRNSEIFRWGGRFYSSISQTYQNIKKKPDNYQRALQAARICDESTRLTPKPDAKRIVILSIRSWPLHLVTESLIAAQLRRMGHSVSFLWCSDSLPFCMNTSSNVPKEYQRNCESCCGSKKIVPGEYFERDDIPSAIEVCADLQQQLTNLDIAGCRHFTWRNVPYGDLVYRGVAWFLRRSILTEGDTSLYKNAILSAHAAEVGIENVVQHRNPDAVVLLNGDFSVERLAGFVLKRLGVRFIAYDYTFHGKLGVSVNDSLWDQLSFDKGNPCKSAGASKRERKQALAIFKQWRKSGGYQGNLFWTKHDLAGDGECKKKLKLDARPLVTAYTNLTFESSVVGKDRVFRDQFEWISSLISWFKVHPNYQLVIRIHPAEVRKDDWRPNESIADFISKKFLPLPENIRLIEPDSAVSSYDIGMASDAILVYSSTLGLEFAERGKQVITAAHVHYAGRGFTVDPVSEEDYFSSVERQLLNPALVTTDQHEKLINYVGWFMFRRLLDFEPVTSVEHGWPELHARTLDALGSPKMRNLTKVCRLIADGETWW